MIKGCRTTLLFLLIIFVFETAYSQGDDKVDVFTSVREQTGQLDCKEFKLGAPIETIVPEYPAEARAKRLGGAVRLEVLVDETGTVKAISDANGDPSLVQAAKDAAARTRFTVSRCDDQPVPVTGVLTFNFIPIALTDLYVVPATAKEFGDLKETDSYYEPVVMLTENYKLGFGYADGGFHGEAPLTKGDFAHSLRLTLDLLQQQAEISNKIPREIDLYFSLNPTKLKNSGTIVDFDPTKPYSESISFLISKYDIALINKKKEFQGKLPLSQNEVIMYWTLVFGADAVPVNFSRSDTDDRIMTRGDFALFLQESLFVLTYKVLP